MVIEEFFNYRQDLLEQSKDSEGFINQGTLLSEVLPSMLDSKLIDSEDYNSSYYLCRNENFKINAYCVNESGERLQLFIIDENSIDLNRKEDDLTISLKNHYDNQFKRCTRFVNKAIKRHLEDVVQDSSPVKVLISQLSSTEGIEQFDVIEVFLISLTATVSNFQPKRMEFENEELKTSFTKGRENIKKNILIKKRLIDLNFLYSVLISQGNREALIVDFQKIFDTSIEAIQAADEENFESFLCVLPANILAGLYKEHSSRLLEKNVRSFLQFRGVNKGIRETIRVSPEKFIAYNNGLTITATSGDISREGGKVFLNSLTDFQIVNGGQTTATIYFTYKDGFDISKVNVMAKINITKNNSEEELEELISDISTYSNAQSRVSKVDLRSRNSQLVKLKSLSESILTPSGLKWFFERSKGEFNTKLRIAGSNKNRLKKEYPTERRFSKEQLAKYFTAWQEHPYMVKKGGEKVFRFFIEELSGEGKSKKAIIINRNFYEELISKIILFKSLEKIYGQGKSAIGQIRSAVIPYSLSILYKYTDGSKDAMNFDLSKIWLHEGLDNDLEVFFKDLLQLMNDLIKKYAKSDDLGEYSKNPELWNSILHSNEIKKFMSSNSSLHILNKYAISKNDLKLRNDKKNEKIEVNFEHIFHNVLIQTNGILFYKKILSSLNSNASPAYERLVSMLINVITKKKDLSPAELEKEKSFINNIRINHPEIFDQLKIEHDFIFNDTLNYIVQEYNKSIEKDEDVIAYFEKISKIFAGKGKRFSSSFHEIGKKLKEGNPPNIQDIYYASHSFLANNLRPKNSINSSKIVLNELEMRKMVEWDSSVKILSTKERSYVADFAYGLKKLNDFHEKNLRGYLNKLIKAGYKS